MKFPMYMSLSSNIATVLRNSIPSITASIILMYSFSYGLLIQWTVTMKRIIKQSINFKTTVIITRTYSIILTSINEDGAKRVKNIVATNGIRLKISHALNQ